MSGPGVVGAARKPRLVDDATLERSSVVANNAMNRQRGLTGPNGYARELGFDPFDFLAARSGTGGDDADADNTVAWLDLCCGSGRALLEAERRFADELPEERVALVGVDLVDHFLARPRSSRLELVAEPASAWRPDPGRDFTLITCVHGLHYVGDKLGLLAAMASWLAPDGRLVADFDPASIRRLDGGSAARATVVRLRAAGLSYDARRHRITCDGRRSLVFPATYCGADDAAGPGYTGQPAVHSYYDWPRS